MSWRTKRPLLTNEDQSFKNLCKICASYCCKSKINVFLLCRHHRQCHHVQCNTYFEKSLKYTRFPYEPLEVRCVKIGPFILNYFWTFQIKERIMMITDKTTDIPSSIFQKHILEIINLIQLKKWCFLSKFLLLVHSYFVTHF